MPKNKNLNEIKRCLTNAKKLREVEKSFIESEQPEQAERYAREARFWETKAADLQNPPEQKFQLLCIWCGAPWTENMMKVEANAASGCDTCGYGSGAYGTVKVICDSCCRVVYEKEFDETL